MDLTGFALNIFLVCGTIGALLFLPGIRKGSGKGWVLLGLLFLFLAFLGLGAFVLSLFE